MNNRTIEQRFIYYLSIGFEVHIELKTQSKMFCGCGADYFGKEPNTQTCPVCLGLPGALPVPNKKAIEWTILLGLALGCEINLHSKFDRKNYFYPDLAKGYQISQYDEPFCKNGSLKVKHGSIAQLFNCSDGKNSNSSMQQSSNRAIEQSIRINRVHLEEDTAKLNHATTTDGDVSLIDFNRSGVPLLEIVTEPDFHDLSAVKEYLKSIQRIVRYLGISDADMEKGTMRVEPSISLSAKQNSLANYRVEIKNINSFKFAERAILYEIKRQTEMLEKGEKPEQETRGWDENKNLTILQRSKENAEDYRYFPEPDIPPFVFKEDFVENLRKSLPELPEAKKARYVREFGLSEYEARIITDDLQTVKLFEQILTNTNKYYQILTNTIKNDKIPKEIAKLIINKKVDIYADEFEKNIVNLLQPVQSTVTDEEIRNVIKIILSQNEKAVADYKSGRTQVLGFLTGMCMRGLKGRVDVKTVQEIIKLKLKE